MTEQQRYYFDEDRKPGEPPHCVLCGTEHNLRYGGCCHEWFCPKDVGNWTGRGMAMAARAKKHLMEKIHV